MTNQPRPYCEICCTGGDMPHQRFCPQYVARLSDLAGREHDFKLALTPANLDRACAEMAMLAKETGEPIAIKPTHAQRRYVPAIGDIVRIWAHPDLPDEARVHVDKQCYVIERHFSWTSSMLVDVTLLDSTSGQALKGIPYVCLEKVGPVGFDGAPLAGDYESTHPSTNTCPTPEEALARAVNNMRLLRDLTNREVQHIAAEHFPGLPTPTLSFETPHVAEVDDAASRTLSRLFIGDEDDDIGEAAPLLDGVHPFDEVAQLLGETGKRAFIGQDGKVYAAETPRDVRDERAAQPYDEPADSMLFHNGLPTAKAGMRWVAWIRNDWVRSGRSPWYGPCECKRDRYGRTHVLEIEGKAPSFVGKNFVEYRQISLGEMAPAEPPDTHPAANFEFSFTPSGTDL